jgi:hypothetical protein
MVLQHVRLSIVEIVDLLNLCKNTRWVEGIEIVLKSKCCSHMFGELNHKEQNDFVWGINILPFITDESDSTTRTTEPQESPTGK